LWIVSGLGDAGVHLQLQFCSAAAQCAERLSTFKCTCTGRDACQHPGALVGVDPFASVCEKPVQTVGGKALAELMPDNAVLGGDEAIDPVVQVEQHTAPATPAGADIGQTGAKLAFALQKLTECP